MDLDRRNNAAPDPRREADAPQHDQSAVDLAPAAEPTRGDVLAREKATFGGFKFGAAFFGWLTATGAAVLLTALAAAVGAAIGLGGADSADEAANAAAENSDAIGIASAIVVGVILLVSYFAGGYVAGRMSRFSGIKQGLAVWIWAVAIALIVAVVTAIAGSQWDVLGRLNSFPRIPISPETATAAGILTLLGAAVVTLVGALLGGMTGMRYHRRIDRVGLGR